MSGAFTPGGYRELVAALRSRGYGFVGFDVVRPERRDIVLRHDIDMSIARALAMARLEAELGVGATYFVLLRTELYNPLSRDGLADLRAIAACGHDIGLHFDASLYAPDRAALDAAASREAAMLESALDRPVRMLSLHRPAPALIGDPRPLGGRSHAYEPRFMKDIGYCSDSRAAWHHGAPLEHTAIADGCALQLLTHPIWWMGESEQSPPERLQRFLAERYDTLDAALATNCEIHVKRRRA